MKKEKLKVGDTVMLDPDWGKPQGGKTGKILKIEEGTNSQSGIMVLVDFYIHPLDSDWLEKINTMF